MELRACEICGVDKPTILFAKNSLTCKVCTHNAGTQEYLQRRKRKDESTMDNRLCKKFLKQHTVKPTGWEMTLC
jgi:hypothetical protein